jgi:putative endonuclease
MQKKDALAKKGEEEATKYLTNNGYEIICRNWIKNHLEIDIIAKKNNKLIIVEVKTRNSDTFGLPEEFVNYRKQKNLVKAAQLYADIYAIDEEIQFDIIAIIMENENFNLNHISEAFSPLIGM